MTKSKTFFAVLFICFLFTINQNTTHGSNQDLFKGACSVVPDTCITIVILSHIGEREWKHTLHNLEKAEVFPTKDNLRNLLKEVMNVSRTFRFVAQEYEELGQACISEKCKKTAENMAEEIKRLSKEYEDFAIKISERLRQHP